MYRGTEPTLTFTLPFDSAKVTALFITFSQKASKYDLETTPVFEKVLTDCQTDGNKIRVTLTESETLQLKDTETLEIQMRGVCDGKKFASNICKKTVLRILKDGPLPGEVEA